MVWDKLPRIHDLSHFVKKDVGEEEKLPKCQKKHRLMSDTEIGSLRNPSQRIEGTKILFVGLNCTDIRLKTFSTIFTCRESKNHECAYVVELLENWLSKIIEKPVVSQDWKFFASIAQEKKTNRWLGA